MTMSFLRLAGCHMGSVGALGSVNTVVAALLGHFMLGEALRKLHVLAMFLAVGGAAMIWDPENIGTADSKLLGNALALLSGILSGCMYVFSRSSSENLRSDWLTSQGKCGNASSLMLTTMAMGQRWLVCWILAVIPAVPNGTVSTLLDVPGEAVSWWVAGSKPSGSLYLVQIGLEPASGATDVCDSGPGLLAVGSRAVVLQPSVQCWRQEVSCCSELDRSDRGADGLGLPYGHDLLLGSIGIWPP